MTTDDQNESSDLRVTGLDIAMKWAKLPPEHLRAALKALDPQLVREHEYRMVELRLRLRLQMAGMIVGGTVTLAATIGAVLLTMAGERAVALALIGPGLLALVSVFVLGKSNSTQTRSLLQATDSAITATQPAPP